MIRFVFLPVWLASLIAIIVLGGLWVWLGAGLFVAVLLVRVGSARG